jgi:hypothetical protein
MQVQLVIRSTDIPNLNTDGTVRPKYTGNLPTQRINAYDNGTTYRINLNQTSMLFRNLTLYSILSPNYKEGEIYCIELRSLTFGLCSNGSTFSNNEQDRTFSVVLSGLPFLQQNSNGVTSAECIIAHVRVPSGATTNVFTYYNRKFYFKSDYTLLTRFSLGIEYRDIESPNTVQPSSGSTLTTNYPNITAVFSIYKA